VGLVAGDDAHAVPAAPQSQTTRAALEAIVRVFDHYGNRDNKLRARMKWLVDTMGWEEVQARVIKERRLLLGSSSWPGGIPDEVEKVGAGVSE
jgi:sulfite reductase beta subunit-like hemoprotein